MKLIVGLGNPGKEYENTRHNAGFMVVDEIASKLNMDFTTSKFKGLLAKKNIQGETVLLLKPSTYMNLSGEAVYAVMNFYNIDVKDLLVIYDDKDTELSRIRLRAKGSAGGQNGMKNIISHLHTEEFNRIRVGIGNNNGKNMADFVLSSFNKEDRELFMIGVKNAADAAIESLSTPFEKVMSKYNGK